MSSSRSKLFAPLRLGSIGTLQHRVVLAPLTRNRATEPELAPSQLAVQYYRQRASPGGLLITEAVHISPESLAYPSTPGIWSTTQVEAWRQVTEAVHERGGLIVCQLWHTGRVAHPDFAKHPANVGERYRPGVSASQVQIVSRNGKPGKTLTYDGIKDFAVPRELSMEDLQRLIDDYTHAAQNAKAAGFDGVEVHAAHGYLIDQFLNDGVNCRTDQYGGSCENRCRLLRQVVEAVSSVWADGKVGVRLSPHDAPNGGNTFYGCTDSNPDAIYSHAVQTLNQYPLAYLLVTEPRWVGKHDANPEKDPGFQMPLINLQKYRSLFRGVMIGAGGFTPATSYEASMEDRQGYDAIAFGRWFISNPDLPERLRAWHQNKSSRDRQQPTRDTPWLNRYDRNTFYASGAEGYIDYPSMEYEGAALSSNATTSLEHEGMIAGKYQLMDPSKVGTSLTVTESKEARSKL